MVAIAAVAAVVVISGTICNMSMRVVLLVAAGDLWR